MRILRAIGLIVILLLIAAPIVYWTLQPPAPLPAPERGGAFHNVTIIQPGESRLLGQSLTIAGAGIGTIAPTEGGKPGSYAGMFVLPGLINMHGHHPPQAIPVARDLFPLLNLMHGVTGVRDAGDIDGKTVAPLRELIRAGKFAGPRIFACGPFVDGPRKQWENTRSITDPREAKAVVHDIKAAGYDCVKLYDYLGPDVLAALIDAAKEEGMPTIGHVPRAVPYPGGIGDVQHFTGVPFTPSTDPRHFPEVMDAWASVDDAQIDRIVKITLANGTANTPTLVTIAKGGNFANYEAMRKAASALLPRYYADVLWHPTDGLPRDVSEKNLTRLKQALAVEKRVLKRLFDAGATLHIGTDSLTGFVIPGIDVWEEMREFADAGIPLEQVWKIATSGNGSALSPNLGRLIPGAPADFLIFREDPTKDLANLSTLEAVVADGRLYTKQDLANRFERLKAQWSNPIVDTIMVEATRVALARFKASKK